MQRDAFCNYCGTKYPEPLRYPRTCASCKAQVWSNPIPVSVVIVPIVDGARRGVLAVRPLQDRLVPGASEGFAQLRSCLGPRERSVYDCAQVLLVAFCDGNIQGGDPLQGINMLCPERE